MSNKAPPPPSDWSEQQEWSKDPTAVAEDSKWPDAATLKGTKDENRLRLLRNSGQIAVCLMWFFAAVFVVSLCVWLWHFLVPVSHAWLSDEQLSKIQTVIFSGSIGALVSGFAQKHIIE